jgi:orotate phosphoribosyltransferase
MDRDVTDGILTLIDGRRGHFRFESGHHGDLWFDLETLCARPRRIRPIAADMARRLSSYQVDGICGPLTEGAFIAMLVASELDVEFSYAERVAHPERDALFSVEYRLPAALRTGVAGKRIAIVNDVISAGSAVRGAFADLEACGARIVAIGALLVLGSAMATFAAEKNVPIDALAEMPNNIWPPSACPLCAAGVPLEVMPDR